MHYITVNKLITKSIYKQIADSIATAIEEGVLVYNDKLPTERELCQLYGISKTTAKMAYDSLISEGKIKRIKGKGTYVTNRPTYHAQAHTFFALEYDNHFQCDVLLLERSSRELSVLHELELPSNQVYIQVACLYHNKTNPHVLKKIYVPQHLYPSLHERWDASKPVYSQIETIFGHNIGSILSTFSPMNASPSEALLLRLDPDEAIYLVRSKVFDNDKRVLAYICDYYPGNFTEFEVTVYAE